MSAAPSRTLAAAREGRARNAAVVAGGGLLAWAMCASAQQPDRAPLELFDPLRRRPIAVEMHFPAGRDACTAAQPCPVAFISPGHRLPHTQYTFIAHVLASRGHLAVSIQHELPSDPPLVTRGDAMTLRMPAWQRGADTLRFVKQALALRHPEYDWARLQLIGHSHGGDLSALALQQWPDLATGLITLDHRRHPLPRNASIRVLSIRASDFEADPGALPAADAPAMSQVCIATIAGARHDAMHDGGPAWLRARIASLIDRFVHERACGA